MSCCRFWDDRSFSTGCFDLTRLKHLSSLTRAHTGRSILPRQHFTFSGNLLTRQGKEVSRFVRVWKSIAEVLFCIFSTTRYSFGRTYTPKREEGRRGGRSRNTSGVLLARAGAC